MTPEQERALAIAAAAAAAGRAGTPLAKGDALAAVPSNLPQVDPPPEWSAGILPFSANREGVHFDPNAGLMGSILRSFTLPGEVYSGKVDPLSNQGIDRAAEMGTVFSPAAVGSNGPLLGSTTLARTPRLKPPTADALRSAASEGYDRARGMGVDYTSDAVASVAASLRAQMEQDGILGELAPKTFGIIDKLSFPPPDSVAPFTSVEAARRAAGRAGRDFTNPTEQEASRRVVQGLDQFVDAPPEGSVVAGPVALVSEAVKNARGNYAAAARSDTVTGVEEAADLRAAAANSGTNLDNAIRTRVASLLLDPKKIAGFSPDEVALLKEVAGGTASRNTLRAVGNLLGGGLGLGAIAAGGLGGAAGMAWGLPGIAAGAGVPAVGYGAKTVANALTRRALGRADEAVRSRSPLFEEMQKNAPAVPLSPTARAAIVKALLLAEQQRNPFILPSEAQAQSGNQ